MPVVAGIDDSPAAAQVVVRAIDEARWRGTDLHLVHVTYLPVIYADVPIEWDEVVKAQNEAVWGGVERVLESADLPVERVNLNGYPPDVLVEYANEVEAALLVVGTRGRGEFASLILGSTSHRAIHLATCDVLVVKTFSELLEEG
jgi:nucleotide-binding universal stress UspA family protein